MEKLARGWLIAMAGVLTADVFLSAEYSKQLWLLLALGPALLSVARGSPESEAFSPDKPRTRRTSAWATTALGATYRHESAPARTP